MSKIKDTTIGDIDLSVKEWTLQERLQHQTLFLPLIESITVNGAVVSGDDEDSESMAMAALVSGVMQGLQKLDMDKACEIIFAGGGIKFPGKTKQPMSWNVLEENDADLSLIYTIIAFFIQVNYGSLLKKGLEDFLVVLMGAEV